MPLVVPFLIVAVALVTGINRTIQRGYQAEIRKRAAKFFDLGL